MGVCVYYTPMGIESVNADREREASLVDLIGRLERVENQVHGLQGMLAGPLDCTDVLTQLVDARRALDHIGFLLVAGRLAQCMTHSGDTDATTDEDAEEMRRLFLRLA